MLYIVLSEIEPQWFWDKKLQHLGAAATYISYAQHEEILQNAITGVPAPAGRPVFFLPGKELAKTFLSLRFKRGLNACLGNVVQLPQSCGLYIPSYGYIDLRSQLFKRETEALLHLRTALTCAASGITMPDYKLLVPETGKEVEQFIAELPPGEYAIDIETSGNIITHFGLGNASFAFSIPLSTPSYEPYWRKIGEEEKVFTAIRSFLCNPAYAKGGHNIRYDLAYIVALFKCWPANITYDTYFLSHAISPEAPHSLAALAARSSIVFPAWKLLGHVDRKDDEGSDDDTE